MAGATQPRRVGNWLPAGQERSVGRIPAVVVNTVWMRKFDAAAAITSTSILCFISTGAAGRTRSRQAYQLALRLPRLTARQSHPDDVDIFRFVVLQDSFAGQRCNDPVFQDRVSNSARAAAHPFISLGLRPSSACPGASTRPVQSRLHTRPSLPLATADSAHGQGR